MITLTPGDCRDVLATLPTDSVQCVVTSPPYYGLRDYGTAQWDGGDAACDHTTTANRDSRPRNGLTGGLATVDAATIQRGDCRCGATRIDRQIGLEATPDEYLATMVAVFREVKRVLRDDGVCFINLGDSYCSANLDVQYSLREDCSLEELQRVALAMFGMRITGDQEARQGAMPQVLRDSVQGKTIYGQPAMASGRIKDQLSTSPREANSGINRADQANEDRRIDGAGREVCVLRRDDTAIPDVGSHPGGRRSTSEATDGQKPVLLNHDLSRGEAVGVPEGSVSGALLQLQLRDRLMGLLSARQFASAEIPAAVRACFKASPALKPKDLLMMPARLAIALQADGWWLRSDIIWHKPNPMPESVTDRPTSAHEHVFLLTKRATYYYDADAVREEAEYGRREWSNANGNLRRAGGSPGDTPSATVSGGDPSTGRNLRNVWTIATAPYAEAHFATFPPALAERCIKAGSRPGDTILDPFAGAGTTLLVADRLQRHAIGIELNPEYTRLAMQRCHDDAPLFTSWPPATDPADARMADLFATRMAAD